MLTRTGHALVLAILALLTLGLGTANPVLVAASALPLVALALGLADPAARVEAVRLEAPERARAGDVVEVHAVLEAGARGGLVAARVDLPDAFDVVGGESARLVEVPDDGQARLELKVRAAKRGRFEVGPVRVAPLHAAGVRAAEATPATDATSLDVSPALVPVQRLRRLRGTSATLAPEGDEARVGLKTTDFRELREYRSGDPPRSVNWKATARLGPAADAPLVNEYEVEGRKAVWFMLDAGRHMAVGTTVENGFELGVAAAGGLALSYIDRGYKVGLHTYNGGREEPLYPDAGQGQYRKLMRRLADLSPGDADEGPLDAVERCRDWLVQVSPMVVFVTRTETDTARLEDAVRRIRSLDRQRRRPIVVVEPQAFHLVPGGEAEQATSRLLEHLARPRHERLRRLGALVIPWNPEREPLERLLFRGVQHHA